MARKRRNRRRSTHVPQRRDSVQEHDSGVLMNAESGGEGSGGATSSGHSLKEGDKDKAGKAKGNVTFADSTEVEVRAFIVDSDKDDDEAPIEPRADFGHRRNRTTHGEDDTEEEDEDDYSSDDSDDYSYDHEHGIDSEYASSEDEEDREAGFAYVWENQRRYLNSDKYPLPNDETEQERLDLVHAAWMLVNQGRLHYAPVRRSSIKRALDIGTGTGGWAIDLGDTFPSCEIVGTDLCPIQSPWVPPNVSFEINDFESPSDWDATEMFDYIHLRNLAGSVSEWPALLRNVYRHLNPGTIVEIQEMDFSTLHCDDGTLKPTSALVRYFTLLKSGFKRLGKPIDVVPRIKQLLIEAGFSDPVAVEKKVHYGPWGDNKHQTDLGTLNLELMRTSLEAYGLSVMTKKLGLEASEVRSMIAEVIAEMESGKIHAYAKWYVFHARRPFYEASGSDDDDGAELEVEVDDVDWTVPEK